MAPETSVHNRGSNGEWHPFTARGGYEKKETFPVTQPAVANNERIKERYKTVSDGRQAKVMDKEEKRQAPRIERGTQFNSTQSMMLGYSSKLGVPCVPAAFPNFSDPGTRALAAGNGAPGKHAVGQAAISGCGRLSLPCNGRLRPNRGAFFWKPAGFADGAWPAEVLVCFVFRNERGVLGSGTEV